MERYEEVLVALRRIIRAIDLQSKRLIQVSGLSGPQLLLMKAIGEGGRISAGQLARTVNLSQGTVTTILDRLEKKELIQRERSPEDKRRIFVSLSSEGEAALAKAPALLQEHFIKRFRALESWEQHLIISSLLRVATMMDAQDLDAAPLLDTHQFDIVS